MRTRPLIHGSWTGVIEDVLGQLSSSAAGRGRGGGRGQPFKVTRYGPGW